MISELKYLSLLEKCIQKQKYLKKFLILCKNLQSKNKKDILNKIIKINSFFRLFLEKY